MREREFSDVRANGGRSSCNEIQPYWIYGAVSGVERPSLLNLFVRWHRRNFHRGAQINIPNDYFITKISITYLGHVIENSQLFVPLIITVF